MDRLMSLRQKAAGFFVRKTRVSASVSNAVASMGIAEWNDQDRSQGHRLLKVPCWDQVSAELGETFKPIRALLLSLGTAVNSSSWARKDKSHWHNVQNSILSRNLDPALWRTNGRCIYIKHEPPPILCLWSTDSFLPGFTGGCRLLSPITILLYFPSIPTTPLLLSSHLQVYTSRFCTHRSAGPHKCSSSSLLATTVAGSQGLGWSYCSFLKQDSEDLSLDHLCNEGKENHMRGCISVISLGSRINESLWTLGIERYKEQTQPL